MAATFPTIDDFVQRKTWKESDGTAYRRVYKVSLDLVADGGLPVEGDPMPGESAALLGPFIEKGGISFGKMLGGGFQEVVLKCKKLLAR